MVRACLCASPSSTPYLTIVSVRGSKQTNPRLPVPNQIFLTESPCMERIRISPRSSVAALLFGAFSSSKNKQAVARPDVNIRVVLIDGIDHARRKREQHIKPIFRDFHQLYKYHTNELLKRCIFNFFTKNFK